MTESRATSLVQRSQYRPRRHLWLSKDEPLVCPNGHKLKHNAAILEHECLICQYEEPHQRGQCNARVYVLVIPGGMRFVAEVTVPEMLHMKNERMSVDDVIRYLRGA